MKKDKKNKLDVWVVSLVSTFLKQCIDTHRDNMVDWYMEDGSIVEIDFDKKTITFVDWVGDMKTYFAIIGVASSHGIETLDCFTQIEKDPIL